MNFSIIIPTLDRPGFLKECLQSIGDGQSVSFEILVVDQTEDLKKRKEIENSVSAFSQARYFHLLTKGSSQAKNFGIRHSRGKIIGFLDDDCLVSPEWLKRADEAITTNSWPICLLGKIVEERVEGKEKARPWTKNAIVQNPLTLTLSPHGAREHTEQKPSLLPPHRLESWEASRLGGKEIWKFILFLLPSILASKHPSLKRGGLRWGGELLPKDKGGYRLWNENTAAIFQGKIDPWIFKATGANIFVPRVILDDVGLFDERFGPGSPWRSGEDADLLYRISLSGVPIAYVPSVAIVHRDWRDPVARYQNYCNYGRGVGGLLGKYLISGDLFFSRTIALRFSRKLVRLIWGILSLDQAMAQEGYGWSSGIITGFISYLHHQNRLD